MDLDLSSLILSDICAVSKINLRAGESVTKNSREKWGISIKTAGKTIFHSNGKNYISDVNHIIVLPEKSAYSFKCEEMGECLMVEFRAGNHNFNEILSYEVKNNVEFINIFYRIEKFWTFKKNAYMLKCMSSLYDFLAKLHELKISPYHSPKKYMKLLPAIKYLEDNYNDAELNNEILAEIAGISTIYFRKTFTDIYNISPMKYIKEIRISKAQDMLLSDCQSITDIAEMVGFSSVYHFSKTFKKMTGYSPSEYSRFK